ncbi:hypothetical protein MtrunA17_Chr6g0483471 [Medicago truncatula]|uniref:Transmembrane protein n=1 Tax=Medicago truncatula TaxID=3880 RepID=A0A396HJE8_MEDTR|nr:hypothetical protein MtrunA17_Chr6g0483471 [Medicago truncatula]
MEEELNCISFPLCSLDFCHHLIFLTFLLTPINDHIFISAIFFLDKPRMEFVIIV